MRTGTRRRPKPPPQCTAEPHPAQQYIWCCPNSSTSMKRAPHLLPPRAVAAPGGSGFESRPSRSERGDLGAPRARARPRQDETRREGEVDVDVLPQRPRRELASVLAPTQRRAPPREMAPPRGRRRDQPRASGERRSAATMRRKCRYVSCRDFLLVFKNLSQIAPGASQKHWLPSTSTDVAGSPPRTSRSVRAMGDAPPHEQNEKLESAE